MNLKRLYPQLELRRSDYTIGVEVPGSDRFVLAHGYSGAIDEVARPLFEWVMEAPGSTPPDADTTAWLCRRGYLTRRSGAQERELVRGMIERFFAAQDTRAGTTLILSYDCDLRCVYCTERSVQREGGEKLSRRMSDEVLDSAFRFIEDSGNLDITLFGGEPFMAGNEHQLKRLFTWLKERRGTVHCVSNGHNWRAFEELFDPAVIRSIQVTIDGPPEIHDRRRIGPKNRTTFWTILDNVEWALQQGLAIVARVNVDRRNAETLEALTEIIEARRLYDHQFSMYIAPVQENGVMKSAPLFNYQEMFERVLDTHTRACMERPPGTVRFNTDYLPYIRNGLRNCLEKSEPLSYNIGFCGAYTSMNVLDPFGRIYACWDLLGQPENAIGAFHPELRYDPPNSELWRSRHQEVLLKQCIGCPYVLLHGGGCQAQAFFQTGRYRERLCEDYPARFSLAVQAALDGINVRTRPLAWPRTEENRLRISQPVELR